MKTLFLAFLLALIAPSRAAEGEKLPDWMNTKIPVRRNLKPSTVAEHLAFAKQALGEKSSSVPADMGIPAELLTNRLGPLRPTAEELSYQEFVDLVLKEAGVTKHVWEASKNGPRFVQLYQQAYDFRGEALLALEKAGKFSANGIAEMAEKKGKPLSPHCKVNCRTDVLAEGLPSDLETIEAVLKPWQELGR